jgi:hypothetical protein
MQIKVKSLVLAVSLFFNGIITLLFITTSFSNTSTLSIFSPGDGYTTAAAVVIFPPDGAVAFELIEININRGDKAFLQFLIKTEGSQGSLILNALYDHDIVNIRQTGSGIEITALRQGSTLVQTLTSEGIKNIALITVL